MRPYLRAANVTWQGLNLDDVKEMNFSAAEAVTYELRAGDVLLSEASGSASEVGKPVIWQGEVEGCCFQNTLIRVRSREPLPEYLRLVFLRAALMGEFAQAAPGVGIHHLGSTRLAEWPIPLCAPGELVALVANVDRQFSLVDSVQARLVAMGHRAESLRRAIFARAFRGELVPQNPDDEAASVLLERIAVERAAAPKVTRKRKDTAPA
jgi:type I restriction enzyme S subunit